MTAPKPVEEIRIDELAASSDRQCVGEHSHGAHVWHNAANSWWCRGFVGRAGVAQPSPAAGGAA
jgi:hypothetical protein